MNHCQNCQDLAAEIRACPCGEDEAPPEQPQPFVIEKGIPLPEPKTTYEQLFRRMEVGDSVYIVTSDRTNFRHAFRKVKPDGFRFVVHKNGRGFRLWRVE